MMAAAAAALHLARRARWARMTAASPGDASGGAQATTSASARGSRSRDHYLSDRDLLRAMDFEKISLDEGRAPGGDHADRLAGDEGPTRRFPPPPAGAIADMAATLRAALRSVGSSPCAASAG